MLAVNDDVEPKLLALARGAHGLDPKHLRATLVLAIRGNVAVLPTVNDMLKEDDSHVRYCAIMTLFWAVEVPAIRSALNTACLLECYRREPEEEVRGRLAQFFGEIKLKAAVETLVADLQDPQRMSGEVVWALGAIGDLSVVPALLKLEIGPCSPVYSALGMLATPEAVDFLCDHIDNFEAADALRNAKGPKIRESLSKQLDRLKKKAKQGVDVDSTIARVEAILAEVSEQDPRERLLRTGEDAARAERDRTVALQALRDYDCSELLPRILAVLQSEPEKSREKFGTVGLSDACVRALASSRDPKVSRALFDLGLDERLNDKRIDLYSYNLLDAVNERLGTHYFTWKFLQWHLQRLLSSDAGK